MASFANTDGGTLVIVMETQGVLPVNPVGLQDDGALQERVRCMSVTILWRSPKSE